MKRSLRLLAMMMGALTAAGAAHSQPARRTYANPVDLDYKYSFESQNDRNSHRTGADPVFVKHGDWWFLFVTVQDGYWRSKTLLDWEFVKLNLLPFEGNVAPAAISDGDKLILMQSAYQQRPILYSTAPETGQWDFYTRWMPPLPKAAAPYNEAHMTPGQIPPGPWDPALFKDDDGRWYLYWGSSNVYPLYGIELKMPDKLPGLVNYLGEPKPMLLLQPDQHGWERFGQDHRNTTIKPYMEGAWMTKVGGRYYLQYGAPGTEYNAYANGVYVSDKPLGPFEYAPYNPIAYKPGGFVQGAGHGSTFRDDHGNWWNSGTPWLGYNQTFERRIAMFPAGFEADGQMYVDTRFGDFPHYMPTSKWQRSSDLFTGWMLLSYRKPVTASSMLGEFAAANVADENPRSFWVAAHNRPGETLTLDLGGPRTVRALQVNYADYKSGLYGDTPEAYTQFRLLHSADGRNWSPLVDLGASRKDRPNAYLELPQPVRTRFIRYEHGHVGAANLAIADLRVFGDAGGPAPAPPPRLSARRLSDRRDALVEWSPVPGAVGYNVRWGLRPDRLHLSYQVFADKGERLELRALNRKESYSVAVEAFDENGVSVLGRTASLR